MGPNSFLPKPVVIFFFQTAICGILKCFDIKPKYMLNEKLLCDENDPKFLQFAMVQLLVSLFSVLCKKYVGVRILFKS